MGGGTGAGGDQYITMTLALLRPGRCDRDFKIDYLDDEQLQRLVETFTGQRLSLPPVPPKLAPADVIEIYKENLTSPENFQVALKELLTKEASD